MLFTHFSFVVSQYSGIFTEPSWVIPNLDRKLGKDLCGQNCPYKQPFWIFPQTSEELSMEASILFKLPYFVWQLYLKENPKTYWQLDSNPHSFSS